MDDSKEKMNIVSPGEQLTYDEFTERIYTALFNAYWESLPTQQDPTAFTKTLLQDYVEFFYPPLTKDIIEAAKGIADLCAIEWNQKQFLQYIKIIKDEQVLNEAENIPLLALCNVFRWMCDDIKEAYEKLEAGNYKRVGDYILVDEMPNTVIAYNESKMEVYREVFLEHLISVFKERMQSSEVIDKNLFFETEIAEFSRFFKQGESLKGWSYLKKRLFMDNETIEAIYTHNNNIVLGTYRLYFLKKNNEADLRSIGELFAIKDYLKQVSKVRNELQGTIQPEPSQPAAGGGNRIPLLVSPERTKEYFMELAKELSGTPQLMTEEDVLYWLNADFEGFENISVDRQINLGGKSNSFSKVRYYVYQFWYNCGGNEISGTRNDLCKMLLRRFKTTMQYGTLKSHLSDSAILLGYLREKIIISSKWKR